MRKLVENTVYNNFKAGLTDMWWGIYDTTLGEYLTPMQDMNYKERKK